MRGAIVGRRGRGRAATSVAPRQRARIARAGQAYLHTTSRQRAQLAATTLSPSQLKAAARDTGEVEVTSLRSQYTRVFATPLGDDEAIIGSVPLNYQASDGSWQPVDDSLVTDDDAGFAWTNQADAYRAEFPARLSDGPVRVAVGDQWVSFALAGASAVPGTAAGNTITYPDALPGVTVQYAATSTGVSESLTLASAEAQSSYEYSVGVSAGLTASVQANDIDVTGADGSEFVSMPLPTVTDAAHDQSALADGVATTLTVQDQGYRLAMTVDRAWLTNGERVFPVVVDPSVTPVTPSEAIDCTMDSGSPTVRCGSAAYAVIGDKSDGFGIRRSLAQFVTSSLPATALVEQAQWEFYFNWMTDTTSMQIDAEQNGETWDDYADWTDRKTTPHDPSNVAWGSGGSGGTGGGYYQSSNQVFSTTITSSDTGWNGISITKLVQGWFNSSIKNQGMLLKADTESPSTGLFSYDDRDSASNQSYLDVEYTGRTGNDDIHTFTSTALTDKTNLDVDPADGHLLLATTDMSISGTGQDSTLTFKHFYNSDDAWFAHVSGATNGEQLGVGWLTDNSLDSTVTFWDPDNGGSADVILPGGVQQIFTKKSASDDFNAPDGVHGDLTHDTSAHTSTFIDHRSGLTYRWTDTGGTAPQVGHLTSITTPEGNTITFSAPSSTDEKVTDTKGRTYDEYLSPDGPGSSDVITSIVDNNGSRSVSFGYNSSGQLTSYTDATGAVTDYGYDSNGMLHEISDPVTGHDVTITYYTTGSTAGKVHTITQTTTDCADGSTAQSYLTSYAYSGTPDGDAPAGADGQTTVTDPGGLVTRYYWDNDRRVLRTADPADNYQTNTYDPTSGQIASFTDNLAPTSSNGPTNVAYDSTTGLLASVTAPKTSSSHPTESGTVDSRSQTSTGSGYQGPAAEPTEITTANGNNIYYQIPATGSTYGGRDEITKVTESVGGTTSETQQLTYNTSGAKNGTVATITNGNGEVTSYSYDTSTGNLLTVTPPAPQNAWNYTEDSDNRVHTVEDGNGHTTTYTYDADDRIVKISFDDSTYLQFWYDTDGNLYQRHDRDGTTDTITYDGLNRPVTAVYQGETQNYCFDKSNHLTSFTNTGGTVTYRYDSGTGYLTGITEPGGTGCTAYNTSTSLPANNSRCIAVQMDGDNRPTAIAFPGGVLQTTTYLQSGKPSEIKTIHGSTTDQDLVPLWNSGCTDDGVGDTGGDELNNMQCVGDEAPSTHVWTQYGYNNQVTLDHVNNIETSTGASPSTENESWAYDTEGNITSYTTGAGTTYNLSNAADELCWSGPTNGSSCSTTPSGDTSYSYDTDGNLTAAGTGFGANYDAANVTSSMNNIDSGGTADSATYADYGQASRISLGTTTYTTSGLGLASECTNSCTGSSAQRIDYTRLPTGQVLDMRVGNVTGYNPSATTNTYYSMIDWQGSILGMTDATGSVAAQYRYNPYGHELAATGSLATSNSIRWLAAYRDNDTHLYHLGARYYSPTTETFLQTDPKSHTLDAAQQDRYTYAGGDPANDADPNGTSFWDAIEEGYHDAIPAAFIGGTQSGLLGCYATLEVGCVPGFVTGFVGGFALGFISGFIFGVTAYALGYSGP